MTSIKKSIYPLINQITKEITMRLVFKHCKCISGNETETDVDDIDNQSEASRAGFSELGIKI